MADLMKNESVPKDEVPEDPALVAKIQPLEQVEPVLKNDVNELVLKDENCDQTVLKGGQTVLRVKSKDEIVLKAAVAQDINSKVTMSTSVGYKLPADTWPEVDVFSSECPQRCGILKLGSVLFALLLILVLVFTVRTRRSRVTRSPAI